MPRKLSTKTYYEKLSEKQKLVFNSYVRHRAINTVARELSLDPREVAGIYRSQGVQLALKEYNEALTSKVSYDQATIIDKLWEEYSDPDTPKAVKVNILTLLGKAIGMWNNSTGQSSPSTVQYNVVNYNTVAEEVNKNKKEVEKELVKIEEESDLPDNIHILEYK